MRGKKKWLLTLLVGIAIFCVGTVLFAPSTDAAINAQINFQGKLTNPDGTNVTDGTYSIVFSMYSVSSGGSAVWTETQSSVSVSAGIFQVALGSVTSLPGSVDFNSSNIYLGVKVGSDAEMTPRIQLSAAPYAFNADEIDGLDSTNIVQLAQGVQTDSSTSNASIFVNKTGTTANILNLQRGGSDVLVVGNDGSTTVKSQTNSTTAFQVQSSASAPVFLVDTTPDASNLISNPGFDANTTGWAVSGTGASAARNTTKSNTYFGNASYQVTTASSGTTTVTVNGFSASVPTGTYTLSFYANASANLSGLAVNFGSGTCTPNTTTVSSGGFQRYYCTVTTTGTTSSITISVTTTSQTWYIDGVQLLSGSAYTPYGVGNVQIRGVINSPVSIRPVSNSTTTFQVADSSGVSLLTADTETVGDPMAIQIGSTATDTTQVLLQLDSFDTFADTSTCAAATNQGGLYYNTKSNAVRACVNGTWEDLVSTASLGLQLFGVVPDSGSNPGDLYGVTGGTNGPCKVSAGANLQTVSWTACVAFSGGRKVIVAAGTAGTTNGVANNFQHLCLTGTNGQPALSTTGAETANLATVSFSSVTGPILCLADIKYSAANNTISDIYDLRTYTTTDKVFVALNSAIGIGTLVVNTTTKGTVQSTTSATANNIAGVIVAGTGSASSSTINAILATGGTTAVKAITGTVNTAGAFVLTTTTAGYGAGNTAKPAEGTATIYNILGVTRTPWTGSTACAINSDACQGSFIVDIDKR